MALSPSAKHSRFSAVSAGNTRMMHRGRVKMEMAIWMWSLLHGRKSTQWRVRSIPAVSLQKHDKHTSISNPLSAFHTNQSLHLHWRILLKLGLELVPAFREEHLPRLRNFVCLGAVRRKEATTLRIHSKTQHPPVTSATIHCIRYTAAATATPPESLFIARASVCFLLAQRWFYHSVLHSLRTHLASGHGAILSIFIAGSAHAPKPLTARRTDLGYGHWIREEDGEKTLQASTARAASFYRVSLPTQTFYHP